MKYCESRGYLVGAQRLLPTDPRHYAVAGGPLVGCNHIQCSTCGASVRNWPGFRIAAQPITRAEHAELYATRAPESSRYLTRDGGGDQFRVYACQCSHTEIASATDLDRGFIEFDGWACAGHPEGP